MMPEPKRIYVECTPTYSTDILTGIQRVVRNVIYEGSLLSPELGVRVIPVIFHGGHCFSVEPSVFDQHQNASGHAAETGARGRISSWLSRLLSSRRMIFLKDWVRRHAGFVFVIARKAYLYAQFKLRAPQSHLEEVAFSAGDVLFLLDGAWGRPIQKEISKAHEAGATVIFALYDLIPVSHRVYCDPVKTADFEKFLKNMLITADGVLCISEAVKNELLHYHETVLPEIKPTPAVDFFHLGVDRENLSRSGRLRETLPVVFEGNSPVFLMVSTIEPRKNHAYLLDAFERLWEQGHQVRLVFVGRVGWEVKSLMDRIASHPQLNRLLFVFNDLNDAELSYCYTHASALVFPSFAEGFGLPIIEALEHELPVIASDIPVHREIGGDLLIYINPYEPQTLVETISKIIETGNVPERHIPRAFVWMNWREATGELLNKLLLMSNRLEDKK